MKLEGKQLVLLTTHFGNNFSGGSLASHEILTRLQDKFDRIIVVGTQLGNHTIDNLEFHSYRFWWQAALIINRLKTGKSIFYGDFYNTLLMTWLKIDFVFTYHDNWPELGELNRKHAFQNLLYSFAYQRIFKNCAELATVSKFKQRALCPFRSDTKLIFNGFKRTTPKHTSVPQNKILMVGNIDARKYELAIAVFNRLSRDFAWDIEIYGHVVERKIASRLNSIPFVSLKGFQDEIPFENYRFLLHLSFTESFGTVFCEAISRKLPVLTFDVGGASELINERNGRLIPAYDLIAMCKAMVEMGADPGTADPESVAHYSWDRAAEQYLELFSNVA